VCTCAHLLVHFPRLRVDGATQQIKQRHEETEIGLLLGVVDRVVPAASREGPTSIMHESDTVSAPGSTWAESQVTKRHPVSIQHVIIAEG
jgi:hypothetical protein